MDKVNLHETTDATIWADEFVRLHGGDKELMVAWFANAIMVGYDQGYLAGENTAIDNSAMHGQDE